MKNMIFTPEDLEQLNSILTNIGYMNYEQFYTLNKKENTKGLLAIDREDILSLIKLIDESINQFSHNDNFRVSPRHYKHSNINKLFYDITKFKSSLENYQKYIPYYHVVKAALINFHNFSENEAEKIIRNSSLEKIESMVSVKKTVEYTIESITNSLNLSTDDSQKLKDLIYQCDESNNIKDIFAQKIIEESNKNDIEDYEKSKHETIHNLVMDTLFAVHDGWVKDNPSEFGASNKKHRHMPSQLIGWEELRKDFILVEPIFKTLRSFSPYLTANEETLKRIYNERVNTFFLDNKIYAADTLSHLIAQGPKFYPAWTNYDKDILEFLQNDKLALKHVIPAIENYGIGNIGKRRYEIVKEVAQTQNPDDIAKLRKGDEQEYVRLCGYIKDLTCGFSKMSKQTREEIEELKKVLKLSPNKKSKHKYTTLFKSK